MPSIEELEARVAALEAQMRRVRGDAAAARVLAGGADRDVADLAAKLDVHKALLDALRATQVEQGQEIADHGRRITGLEHVVRAGFDEMRTKFDTLAVGQSQILVLLNRLSSGDDH